MLPAFASLLAGSALLAQVATAPPPSVTVTTERRAEQVRYHFDNPSNFDTVELVPHFFEQRYDAGNTWLLVAAQYRFLGSDARTEFGLTPRITTAGSDIDSFFNPSGDVITSGTAGLVRLSAFSIDQHLAVTSFGEGDAIGRWKIRVLMGYRRAHATFLPADIVVTHSQPVSTTATFTRTREATVSRVVQSGIGIEKTWLLPSSWRARLESDATPLTRARLTISLPDKYDHDIVADALAFGATGRLTFERPWQRFVTGVTISSSGVWGYRERSNYHVRATGVSVFVRFPE